MREPSARTSRRSANRDDDARFTVRAFAPDDGPELERLLREGLLPGHVAYTSPEADRMGEQFGSSRERLWVAAADGRLIGSIAVIEESPDVGHIYWLRVAPDWQADYKVARCLAQTAARHAREVGFLKLVSQVPHQAEARVVAYYHQMGFEFSRARDIDGRHVLEFYLDLYARGRPGRSA